MFEGKKIGVVVPAYNEEKQIDLVLGTMPDYVDRIVVVDDCSPDQTSARCEAWQDRLSDRLTCIRHERNQGVGGSIITGYRKFLAEDVDVVVKMDGDGQMPPSDLPSILSPVVFNVADYAKGNRLFSGQAWQRTPKVRYLGNAVLSLLSKIASGYWHIADSQGGFTAIRTDALRRIDLDRLHRRYPYENSMLIELNINNCRVVDVPIEPRYGIGEVSSMRMVRVIPDMLQLLASGFIRRLFQKYVVRDFHPLIFFYGFGALFVAIGFLIGVVEVVYWIRNGAAETLGTILSVVLAIFGLQFLLFAMWFDMENNRALRGGTVASGGSPADQI
jgi:glycosyltransferase involved in cell wall biosynthesis